MANFNLINNQHEKTSNAPIIMLRGVDCGL